MATSTKAPEGQKAASRRVPFVVELYRSSVGKKYVMAITGVMMMGFVFAHMVGNLKIYQAPSEDGVQALDKYGEFLREGLLVPLLPEEGALWLLRLGLIAALVLHVHAAYALTVANRRARPENYRSPRNYQLANFASRSMRWTGVIVLLYIGYHLADITLGISPFAPETWQYGAVFDNTVDSLSRVPVAAFYLVANLALGVHLYHGGWSLFQTLGVVPNGPSNTGATASGDWRRAFALGFAAIVVIGNLSFPIAVLTGIVG